MSRRASSPAGRYPGKGHRVRRAAGSRLRRRDQGGEVRLDFTGKEKRTGRLQTGGWATLHKRHYRPRRRAGQAIGSGRTWQPPGAGTVLILVADVLSYVGGVNACTHSRAATIIAAIVAVAVAVVAAARGQ